MRFCAFAPHPLKNGVLVTDPKHISFVRKSKPDFRSGDLVCSNCKYSMEVVFKSKMQRARQLRDSRNAEASTLSSNSRSSFDSIDELVHKTPMHQKSLRTTESSSKTQTTNSIELSVSLTDTNSQALSGRRTTPMQQKSLRTTESSSKTQITSSIELSVNLTESSSQAMNGNALPIQSVRNLLQESRKVMSSSTTDRSAENTKLNKDARAGPKLGSPKPKGVKELRNQINDMVASPTIYDDDHIDDAISRADLNIRTSQEPTTSAAAAKGKTNHVSTPLRSRGIRDYFTSLPDKVTTSSHVSVLRVSPTLSEKSVNVTPPQNGADAGKKRPIQRNSDAVISDDDEPLMSLNYFNPDVRFPQYQPIPKRRRFQHDLDKVMDIYSQSITGG